MKKRREMQMRKERRKGKKKKIKETIASLELNQQSTNQKKNFNIGVIILVQRCQMPPS